MPLPTHPQQYCDPARFEYLASNQVTFQRAAQILASRLKSQPQGSNLSLKVQIPTSSLTSQHQGSNPSILAQIPLVMLNSSLEPQNLLSKCHWPLQGRCPSLHYAFIYTHIGAIGTDIHLTLLLQFFWHFLDPLLLPICPSDLLYQCPCPPTQDQGSRVSDLVESKTDQQVTDG